MKAPLWQAGFVRAMREEFDKEIHALPAGRKVCDDSPFVVITRAAIERQLGQELGHELWLELGPTIEGIIEAQMVDRRPYPDLSEPCISEITKVIRNHLTKRETGDHGQKPETD